MTTHTLFASPFTCSLAVHLVLRQHNIPHTIEWVQRGPGRLVQTAGYADINPKRKVPAVRLPDGELLTEAAAVLAFLDEEVSEPRTPTERRRLLEWLVYLSTELHKQIVAALYDTDTTDDARQDLITRLLPPVLAHLEQRLSAAPTLLGGEAPSGADAYLLWALLLLRHRWPETVSTPALSAFVARMCAPKHARVTLAIEREAMQAGSVSAA